MAGTDDRPDDEGPGPEPDPDSGPDDRPTPDDADPPVPDDDGEPGPDDEGDPPDEGRPGQRTRRRDWEQISVSLTAAAFVVGTLFSLVGSILAYRSVVLSKDSVVVARAALEDSRNSGDEELQKDLSRITFDLRGEDTRLTLEIENRSSRPFVPIFLNFADVGASINNLREVTSLDAVESGHGRLLGNELRDIPISSGRLNSCERYTNVYDSPGSRLLEWSRGVVYARRLLLGTDVLSMHNYVLDPVNYPYSFGKADMLILSLPGEQDAGGSVSRIDDC